MKRSKAYRAAAEKIERRTESTARSRLSAWSRRPAPASSTPPSRPRCGSASTRARPTRWSAARSTCRTAPASRRASRCSPTGAKAEEAEAAGADIVGSDDLVQQIQGGFLDFDATVATPDQMAKVGRIARILGPRGLMPNPKTGTVTMDIGKAVADIKGGKVNFRVDKQANLHLVIGKSSFTEQQLVENYAAALDEVMRSKPSAAKGRYLKKVTFATTMGPGIPVDVNRTRALTEDAPAS